MTTKRQRAAVRFCEERLLDCKFNGDINSFEEVSAFLKKYLYVAKYHPDFLTAYEAYLILNREQFWKSD